MTGKISEDPDVPSFDGTEKIAIAKGGANYGGVLSDIAAWLASLTQTLTNKTINAANNTISNLTLAMFASTPRLDQLAAPAADVSLGSHKLTNVTDPASAQDAATKNYVDAQIPAQIAALDAMIFKGVIDCSANPNYPAADRGWTYKVSVAGFIGGGAGPKVEVGDTLMCITDGTASGTQAGVGANWNIVQVNIDGAVIGPASATSGNIATFSGTSGKVVQDGGKALPTGAVVGDSDAQTLTNKTLTSAVVDTPKHLNFGQCVLAKSGANLVLSPKNGNLLTVNGQACAVPDAGVSLAATGLTVGTLYYIYAVATA
jgi:hypothetical protein